jgi:lipopolysaccharide export system permease protein
MKILDKYISRRFVSVLTFALVAFIAIFVIVDQVEKLDAFIDHKVPKIIIAEYYLCYLPYIVILTLPVAMLLSSLFSVGTMARQNEIIAMKASGFSLYRILFPLLIIAFLISLGALIFGEYVVPNASARQAWLTDEYLEKQRQSWRKRINNLYMRDSEDRLISMRYYHAASNVGNVVSIRKFNGQQLISRIDARTMTWQDSVWVLIDGYERTFAENGKEQAHSFDKMVLTDENLHPEDFAKTLKQPEEMSYEELKAFVEEVKHNGSDPNRWLVDLHLKIAIPFANLIMVLFGAPLSSAKRRGSAATGFGISLAICFIYFGIVKTAQTMGHNGLLPPMFAAWVANIIFASGGILVLVKMHK